MRRQVALVPHQTAWWPGVATPTLCNHERAASDCEADKRRDTIAARNQDGSGLEGECEGQRGEI